MSNKLAIESTIAEARKTRRETLVKLAADKIAARTEARAIRAKMAAEKAELTTKLKAEISARVNAAAKTNNKEEIKALRQANKEARLVAQAIKDGLYAQTKAVREAHQQASANLLSGITETRQEFREVKASNPQLLTTPRVLRPKLDVAPTMEYDEFGNRHKIDTPNTLKAREVGKQLARDAAYNEFTYFPVDTLFFQLPDHTKIFITNGYGTVSKAREDLENVVDPQQYPDYKVIAGIIYTAYGAMQTARQRDKANVDIVFDYVTYINFLNTTSDLAVISKDAISSIWCIMAATGCRANEISGDWRLIKNTYLKYSSPKVSSTNDNLSISLIPLVTLRALRNNIKDLTTTEIGLIIAREHKYFIQQLPMLANVPPRFTRDIYQCLAYNSLLNFDRIVAMQIANHVGHRSSTSSCFLTYTLLNLSREIILQDFIDLAKYLNFI